MLLFVIEPYAVKYSVALVPPPGAGVTTVPGNTPGIARAEAGRSAVRLVEFTKVVGAVAPFTSPEEVDTKPVPVTLIETAVFIGPALTDNDVSVGTDGFVMFT